MRYDVYLSTSSYVFVNDKINACYCSYFKTSQIFASIQRVINYTSLF